MGNGSRNTVSIKDAAYLVVRGLDLDGMNIPSVDAVKAEGNATFAHHITLEGLRIRGHGGTRNTVGISTKCPAWNWVIKDNLIEGAGTGLYLGDSTGDKPFVHGLVEHNVVIASVGYNMQIKHQNVRPSVSGMPTSGTTTIRHNVFSKDDSSDFGSARPNLLIGHLPPSGNGVDDTYEIYGNFLYQNPSEALFQGEGNINFHHNILLNDFGRAVNIRPHNDVPKNVVVAYNTIVANGEAVGIRGADGGSEQLSFGNLLFGELEVPRSENDQVWVYTDAATVLENVTSAPGEGLALSEAGVDVEAPPVLVSGLTKIDENFDGVSGDFGQAGAYGGAAPVWVLGLGQKPR